ncbi:hypothetical protein D9619_006965 [Psilocybe cf. subviscida]|uniref:LsmAD domain-containing protein n=1 Tax=Psilocybe cf. subviscida TaxID=2480587 RepID=A0A8H5EWI1_9AGAR|nr:hypothetical protein D9619_006965 [Psilocybe cf. subviscida]
MATASRQSKGPRKGPPEPNAPHRAPAWGSGARTTSPAFTPPNAPRTFNRQQQPARPNTATALPPLVQNQHHDQGPAGIRTNNNCTATPRNRVLQSLSGLTGTTVTLVTATNQRLEGVISSTAGQGDTNGVTLKDVRDLNIPNAPPKNSLFIASTNIKSYSSSPVDSKPTNSSSFGTDTSQHNENGDCERNQQAWMPNGGGGNTGGLGGGNTFRPSANGSTSWDSFDEDIYTKKLDRNAPDFKERERKALRIANELIGATTNGNLHTIAEGLGILIDDNGANEEEKYGTVIKGAPGQTFVGSTADATPEVLVNDPDGAAIAPVHGAPPSSLKAPSPAPPASESDTVGAALRDYIAYEKKTLTQKQQALAKLEMEKRVADLVTFSKRFKLKQPIPEDLVPILAKDEEKQRLIKEKTKADSEAKEARFAFDPLSPSAQAHRKPVTLALTGKGAAGAAAGAIPSGAASTTGPTKDIMYIPPFKGKRQAKESTASAVVTSTGPTKVIMYIPPIPPFKGGRQAKVSTAIPKDVQGEMPALTQETFPPAPMVATNNASATPAASSKMPIPFSGATSTTGPTKGVMRISPIPPFKGEQQAKGSTASAVVPKDAQGEMMALTQGAFPPESTAAVAKDVVPSTISPLHRQEESPPAPMVTTAEDETLTHQSLVPMQAESPPAPMATAAEDVLPSNQFSAPMQEASPSEPTAAIAEYAAPTHQSMVNAPESMYLEPAAQAEPSASWTQDLEDGSSTPTEPVHEDYPTVLALASEQDDAVTRDGRLVDPMDLVDELHPSTARSQHRIDPQVKSPTHPQCEGSSSAGMFTNAQIDEISGGTFITQISRVIFNNEIFGGTFNNVISGGTFINEISGGTFSVREPILPPPGCTSGLQTAMCGLLKWALSSKQSATVHEHNTTTTQTPRQLEGYM